jgi:acetyltransferase-like isoleucine patch superfamily enzyme
MIGLYRNLQSKIYDIVDKRRYPKHPLIRRSNVLNVKNIHPRAFIKYSHVDKNVIIDENAKVLNSTITGKAHIGANSKFVQATMNGIVKIGKWTTVTGPNTDIYALVNGVQIGSFCSIARNVSIQEYNHKMSRISTYSFSKNFFAEDTLRDVESKGQICIGNDVWIGTHAVILSGAQISDGVVVGANTLISGYVPPYAIVVGSPSKIIKYRFPDHLIARLLTLKWWEWDDDKIKRNQNLFVEPLNEKALDLIA